MKENSRKDERGLSLSDINKLYNYDTYRKSTINKTETVAINQFDDQVNKKQIVYFYEIYSNLNTINNSPADTDYDKDNKMMNNKVTTTNEVAKNVKKTKKDFADKLRKNSMVFPTRKSSVKPKQRSSSSESESSSGSYTSSSRSRSPEIKKPPPPKRAAPAKPKSPQKFMQPSPKVTGNKKLTSEEQMEKLKQNYQFQGFHPYYDKVSCFFGPC